MKRLIYIFLLVTMIPVSCLMEQEDAFDKTPAERTEAFMQECRDVLTASDNIWMLEYYAASDKRYGGYVYFMSFDEDSVTSYFQLAEDISLGITSLYKIVSDDAVTLSFDTYNDYLHYFAEPSSGSYQGMLGDYEYRILGCSDDRNEVYLRGRKSGNEFTLRRFYGDVQKYLSSSVTIMDAFGASPAFELELSNSLGAQCVVNYNTVTMAYVDLKGQVQEITVPFCFTDNGINFSEEVKIGGVMYDALEWDASSASFVSEDGAVRLTSKWIPLKQRTFNSDDIVGFEEDSEGYFGEYNYYARNRFDNNATGRELISKVTFADSAIPDSEPDDNGIVDEFMEVSGMFPSIPDAKITFSVYRGVIYTIENDLGLVTRPSGNKYYIRMIHGSTSADGFYPGYDYLMVGGYVDTDAIALVGAPDYAAINELYLACFEKEDEMDEFGNCMGGAEWHADMLFVRTEYDQESGMDVPETSSVSGRKTMSDKLNSIAYMFTYGPRNYVETPDGRIRSIIDKL